jgi:hypothetical protein
MPLPVPTTIATGFADLEIFLIASPDVSASSAELRSSRALNLR